MSERQFLAWSNRNKAQVGLDGHLELCHSPDALYDSGKRRSIVLSVPITEPGKYYVVFDNWFSFISAKQVTADIRLVHEGEDRLRAAEAKKQATDRERRVGQILGRLTDTLAAMEKEWGTRQVSSPLYIGVLDDPALNATSIWSRRLRGCRVDAVHDPLNTTDR